MSYRLLGLVLVVGILSLLFWSKPQILERVALRIEDTKFHVRSLLGADPQPSEKVVVVAIDEKSVNELGRWPWSRKVIARLINNLSEARVVAVDIVFSEKEDPQNDEALARSVAGHGRVILGYFFRLSSTQSEDPEALRLLEDSEFLRFKLNSEVVGLLEPPYVELNIPEISRGAIALGYLNSEPDPDGIYRKYTLAYIFRGGVYLPLALQALRFYEGKDFYMELSEEGIEKLVYKGKEVPIYDGRFHKINFYAEDKLKLVSAVDVIEGRVEKEFFKGKAVFVGATEIGIYDVRPTPMNPATPGVFLHAFTFSNFISSHFIKSHPLLDLFSLVLLTGVPVVAQRLKNFRGRFVGYLPVLLLYPVISFALFSYAGVELNLFYPMSGFLLSLLTQEGISILVAEKDVRELRRAFSSYVSPQLLQIITRNPDRLKLGGEKRRVTVLFSDIRGFTSLSEKLDPESLVNLLNTFLTPMTEVILKNGGMLDKYIGDAIMALFNAPVSVERHAEKACSSALEMVKQLEDLNPEFEKNYGVKLSIGVGINTGEAVVGNMGSKQRFDYTAIGDTVNLASRLEGLTKLYGVSIILSEFTKEEVGETFLTRKLGVVRVKGKEKAVAIYELLEDTEENRRMAEAFERALDEYMRGNFETAMLLFEEVGIRFGDRASGVFVRRCKELIERPPERWTGIYVAREK